MLINFNHLKTFYNALIQKVKGFRGNWNQNDPSADDYIKNRTHWVDDDGTVHKLDKKFVDVPDDIVTEDSIYPILENNLAPVAFTNNYNSLSGKPNVVQYTSQNLTGDQQAQARENIDVYSKYETYVESDKTGHLYLTYTGYIGVTKILFSSNSDTGYYKVSNIVPNFDDIISFTSTGSNGGQITDFFKGTNCYKLGGTMVVTKIGTCRLEGRTFEAKETGIYFYRANGLDAYHTNMLECTYKYYEVPLQVIDVTRAINGVEPDVFGQMHLSFQDLQDGMIQQRSLPEGYPFINYIADETSIAKRPDTFRCANIGGQYVLYYTSEPLAQSTKILQFDPDTPTVGNNKWIIRVKNIENNIEKNILCRDFKATQYSDPILITENGLQLSNYDYLNHVHNIRANELGTLVGEGIFEITFFNTKQTYTTIDEAYIPDTIARVSDVNEETSAKINELKASGGVGYTETAWQEVVPQQTVEVAYMEEAEMVIGIFSCDATFEDGDKVKVTFDGTVYETSYFEIPDVFQCIGNPSLAGVGEDNGLPFIIIPDSEPPMMICEEGTHTISISLETKVPVTIEPKYIPTTLPSMEDIMYTHPDHRFWAEEIFNSTEGWRNEPAFDFEKLSECIRNRRTPLIIITDSYQNIYYATALFFSENFLHFTVVLPKEGNLRQYDCYVYLRFYEGMSHADFHSIERTTITT